MIESDIRSISSTRTRLVLPYSRDVSCQIQSSRAGGCEVSSPRRPPSQFVPKGPEGKALDHLVNVPPAQGARL